MARTANNAIVNLGRAVDLTAGLIERLVCPSDKQQAFLRDAKAPGLRVRVTKAGAKSFVFEAKLNRKTIRRTIGSVRSWTIEQARAESNRQRVMFDNSVDPREVDLQRATERANGEKREIVQAVTVRVAWEAYLEERRPHWSERTYYDHQRISKAGGKRTGRGTRGSNVTIPGPLYDLMSIRMVDLTANVLEAWAAKQGKARPTYGRLAWRCLKAFINWASTSSLYEAVTQPSAASGRKVRDAFGRPNAKSDVLQREQLQVWFKEVRAINNPMISAALQLMVLLGARPGEVLSLRWENIDFQWNKMIIGDKVEGTRQIPLTAYVAHLIAGFPKHNEWVFYSPTSKAGKLTSPRKQHVEACQIAGIEGLTLHGLRRSFGSLSEWLDLPVGVVAQVMGHKSSAIAEKHYRVRPKELLRQHHQRLEDWMLEQGGVTFNKCRESRMTLVSV